MIRITRVNNNYLKLNCEDTQTFNFFREQFKARGKNVYFDPRYKSKKWDGYINFIDSDGFFLKGLLVDVLKLCKQNNFIVEFDQSIIMNEVKFTLDEIDNSLKGVELYKDTQLPVVTKLLLFNMGMAKLPTSSGKSYMEIAMMNLLRLKGFKNQILIVPRATLVKQIYDDMINNSNYINPDEVGMVDGDHRDWDKPIIIATWQSTKLLLELNPSWNKRFEVLIQDECHVSSSEAKVVKSIITSFPSIYKYGFSATILDKKSDKLEYYNLVSLFGSIVSTDSIKNLQEKDKIADAQVIVKFFKHHQPFEISTYKEYEDIIRNSIERKQYLNKLISEIHENDNNGNILVLVRNVDVATSLQEYLQEFFKDVHLIKGSVSVDDRIDIKNIMKNQNSQILIATEGCFQLGENIPNLTSLVLYQVRKSEISQVQSIGRVLRKSPGKEKAMVYDFADDLIVNMMKDDGEPVKKNYGKKHLKKRLETYRKYGFDDLKLEIVLL